MSDLEVVNKAKNEAIRRAEIAEKRIVELEEANKTLFTMNNNMWVELEMKRAESQGIINRLHQLIKAKEIIKKLKALYLTPVVTKDDVKRQDEILEEVEQFLNSEVEK